MHSTDERFIENLFLARAMAIPPPLSFQSTPLVADVSRFIRTPTLSLSVFFPFASYLARGTLKDAEEAR